MAAYYDMRAWAGYLPRALVLMTLALATAAQSLVALEGVALDGVDGRGLRHGVGGVLGP